MGFVKNHLGLILPLFAILFALEYLMLFDRVVGHYETRLTEQYTVIVVADQKVAPAKIRHADVLVESVEPVDAKEVLLRIRKEISNTDIQALQKILPAFYTLKLRSYPDKRRLERLKENLEAVPGVQRVQVFEKIHDRLYTMLAFLKSNFFVFGGLIGAIGFLLVMKQMVIWQLEHRERMQIMALFGAPVWLRSGVLFRLAIVDATLALGSVLGVLLYLANDPRVIRIMSEMDLHFNGLFRLEDLGILAATGYGIALSCAMWVVVTTREEL